MEKLYRKGEIRMSLHYGNHGGGGNCGCCCSYQAESYNTANQYGSNHDATGGDCGASLIDWHSHLVRRFFERSLNKELMQKVL